MIKDIVIIGASGFVGRHISDYLGTFPEYRVTNVSRRKIDGYVHVTDYKNCPEGDVIIHLAEEPNRALANKKGASYLEAATLLTEEICSKFSGNIIYCSSSTVYSSNKQGVYTTESSVAASDIYTRIKLESEQIVSRYGGISLRLSNLYGVDMSPNNVMSDILNQLDSASPLQLRDTTAIIDLLNVCDVATLVKKCVSNFVSGTFNVGSGQGLSIAQAAQIILQEANQPYRQVQSVMQNNSLTKRVLDISHTSATYNWFPMANFREEVRQLIKIQQESNIER